MIFNGTTVAFSTKANVWKTRYSFTPSCYMTMDNDFLSSNRLYQFSNILLFKHDVNSTYNSFYGDVSVPSTIEVVSNENPSAVKIFKALSLETDARDWTGSVYTNKTRDPFAYQSGELSPAFGKSFVQKEGNQYIAMPRSSTNSSSNVTFVGTLNLSSFADLNANAVEELLNEDGSLDVQLNNIPNVSVMAGEGSVAFFGGSGPMGFSYTLINPESLNEEGVGGDFVSITEDYPYDYSNPGIEVMSYNAVSNTLNLRFFGGVEPYALRGALWLKSFTALGDASNFPIHMMTNPVKDGDNMRGPYVGIKLTSSNSSSAFELYSINVDYEKTKLDGSLG
jgi:hypothetical protein